MLIAIQSREELKIRMAGYLIAAGFADIVCDELLERLVTARYSDLSPDRWDGEILISIHTSPKADFRVQDLRIQDLKNGACPLPDKDVSQNILKEIFRKDPDVVKLMRNLIHELDDDE